MSESTPLRRIRSFARRQGRLTPGQERALDQLWPRFGLEPEAGPLDLDAIFGRKAPRVLEIGFGNGESLAAMAQAAPETDFIGIEVHRPGVGRLLLLLEELVLENVRVFRTDALEVLERSIPEDSLDAVYLFFPDPWHKRRHHKRRIVQPAFVERLRARLKPGGRIHFATDWAEYAEHMLAVLSATEGLRNLSAEGGYVPRPDYRPRTKYEQRGERLGHGVWDLVFVKA